MKKLLSIAILAAALTSCGGGEGEKKADDTAKKAEGTQTEAPAVDTSKKATEAPAADTAKKVDTAKKPA
jgi:hypothetical protein